MTIFAGDAPALDRRTILDIPAEGGEVWDASFGENFTTTPVNSLFRLGELSEATNPSPSIDPAGNAVYGPDLPKMSAQDARDRVDALGLKLNIPEQGIREGALDIMIQRNQEQAARQQVLARAGSTFGTQIAAGLAASIIDALNLASAFVPVVGQARYATLIAGAATPMARLGVRAGVGALEGAVGAAILEPLPLLAARADQTDYGLSDSFANIAFGAVLGGGLHSVGGAISDRLRRSVATETDAPAVPGAAVIAEPVESVAARAPELRNFDRSFDADPVVTLKTTLARQLADDQASLYLSAQARAIDEIRPTLTGERVGNVADLKAQRVGLDDQLATIDDSFRDRAKAFQGQGMSRKQAESAARKSIAVERDQLGADAARIDSVLEMNRQGELNRADLNQLDKGKVPERLKPLIESRAAQIMQGYEQRPLGPAIQTAREQAEQADWTVRESALKAAVVQAMSGREINVQHIFDLQDPAKAAQAMDALRRGPEPVIDRVAQNDSARAETLVKSQRDQLTTAQQDFAEEQSLVDEMLGQLPEADRLAVEKAASAETEAAELVARKAEQYSLAYRAAAVCDLRNGA